VGDGSEPSDLRRVGPAAVLVTLSAFGGAEVRSRHATAPPSSERCAAATEQRSSG